MKKYFHLILIRLIFLFSLFQCSVAAIAEEGYVKLDPHISKKCDVTFKHPKSWKFFTVDSNDDEIICIIAYRNPSKPLHTSGKGMLEGWREISDGSFEIKKIPVESQFSDFGFRKNEKGSVEYLGHEISESAKLMGYSPDVPDDISILKQNGYTLYVGHSHSTSIDAHSRKKFRVKRVDLLIGNQEKSIGVTDSESNRDPSNRGSTTVFEEIFRSIRFIRN